MTTKTLREVIARINRFQTMADDLEREIAAHRATGSDLEREIAAHRATVSDLEREIAAQNNKGQHHEHSWLWNGLHGPAWKRRCTQCGKEQDGDEMHQENRKENPSLYGDI